MHAFKITFDLMFILVFISHTLLSFSDKYTIYKFKTLFIIYINKASIDLYKMKSKLNK